MKVEDLAAASAQQATNSQSDNAKGDTHLCRHAIGQTEGGQIWTDTIRHAHIRRNRPRSNVNLQTWQKENEASKHIVNTQQSYRKDAACRQGSKKVPHSRRNSTNSSLFIIANKLNWVFGIHNEEKESCKRLGELVRINCYFIVIWKRISWNFSGSMFNWVKFLICSTDFTIFDQKNWRPDKIEKYRGWIDI